jgi:hypothetical protein
MALQPLGLQADGLSGRLDESWPDVARNVTAAPPASPIASDAALEIVALVPHGCTNLRVAAFPLLESGTQQRDG